MRPLEVSSQVLTIENVAPDPDRIVELRKVC